MKIFLTTFFFLSLVLSACQDIMPSGIEICKENYMPTNHKGWNYDKSIISIQKNYYTSGAVNTTDTNSDKNCLIKIMDSSNKFIADNKIEVKRNGDVLVTTSFLNYIFGIGISKKEQNYAKLCILPCHRKLVKVYDSVAGEACEVTIRDSSGVEVVRQRVARVFSYTTKRVSEQEEIFNGVATKVVTVSLNLDYSGVLLEPSDGKFASTGTNRETVISGTYEIKFAHNYGIISITRGDGATTKLLNLL